MIALSEYELVDVLLTLDLHGGQLVGLLGPVEGLPGLRLDLLDPEEGVRLQVPDGRRAALGELLARRVLALDQPAFGSWIIVDGAS